MDRWKWSCERARHLRDATGLTQEEAARALGVSIHALQAWEKPTKKRSPDNVNLLRLADLYGVHPREFFSAPSVVGPSAVAFVVRTLADDAPEDLRDEAKAAVQRLNRAYRERLARPRVPRMSPHL